MDLWKAKFDNLWRNKKIEKKYILFVTNFSLANNYYSFKEIIKRKEIENYYKRSPNLKKEKLLCIIIKKKR